MEGGNESDGGKESGDPIPKSEKRKPSIIALVMETVAISPPKGFSGRQWIFLIFFGLIDLLAAMTISMQAPFYPAEAEGKGASATEYGQVFGIFEFVVFLVSPVYGKFMNKIGPKRLFSFSILMQSVSVICFGCLHWLNDHTWFITLCFVCRIVEGLGAAGFFTSTFVLIACEFPQSIATVFASLETFIGLGLIVGPTVGGALYGVGGFPLPFFVVGGCTAATGFASLFILPNVDKVTNADGEEQKGYGIWTILKIPSVAIASLSIISTAMSLGFLSATLEPHIRRFGLTPLETGLMFVVNGGIYALTAPFWGMLCDKIKTPAYVTVLGNFLIVISFILIGPAVFVPIDTILWVTIIGLLFHGLGEGCCFVSTFIVGLKDSMKNGLPDNISTYAVVAGLWQSMISLGAWIGPSAGGFLFDTVGFREGSWLIIVASFVAGMAIVIHFCFTSGTPSASENASKDEESQPLLQPPITSPFGGKEGFEESCAGKCGFLCDSVSNFHTKLFMTDGNGGMEEEDGDPLQVVVMEAPQNKFTCRQWTHLIFFGTIGFLASLTISLQAAFYPIEAESRGATALESGLVFGIFALVVFLLSPVYGKYMNRIGPLKAFISSILINSLAVFSFGILHWISDHTWFIGLSFVARIFQGLGSAGIYTATFVLIACEFPQSIARTFASLETFIHFGFIVGPTVGQTLYSFGGFPVPFFVVGTCLAITVIPTILVVQPAERVTTSDGLEEYGVWTVLKIPSVAIASLSVVTTAISLGFVSATLEPHIRRFGLTPLETGLVFIVNGGMYALTSSIWGIICDRIERPAYMIILGNLLICISFVLIGPATFMPFDTILWVTIIGLLFHGLGLGCCFVSTFIVTLKDSMKNGLPDDISTYTVVAGLWQSMISLGAWIGPSASGLLFDTVGFREGSWLTIVASFVAGMAIVIHFCFTSGNPIIASENASIDEESESLLQPPITSPVGGKQDLEESSAVGPSTKPSTSYGTA